MSAFEDHTIAEYTDPILPDLTGQESDQQGELDCLSAWCEAYLLADPQRQPAAQTNTVPPPNQHTAGPTMAAGDRYHETCLLSPLTAPSFPSPATWPVASGLSTPPSTFRCLFPGCNKLYNSPDAARKHARNSHPEWVALHDAHRRKFKTQARVYAPY